MTLEEERLHFFAEVGKGLDEWSRVEVFLCLLFQVCLHAPHQRAAAAFYNAGGFRSQLSMVDAVAKLALPTIGKLPEWEALRLKMYKKYPSRNALAHYEVIEDTTAPPGRRLTLRPTILDPNSPPFTQEAGFHVNELRMLQTVFRNLSNEAQTLYAELCNLLDLPPSCS